MKVAGEAMGVDAVRRGACPERAETRWEVKPGNAGL